MPGVETSLPLMLTQAKSGKCSIAQVAHWMSTAPAKAYGIPNRAIAPGYDADLVLVDWNNYKPVLREEIQSTVPRLEKPGLAVDRGRRSKCGWSPFEGWNLTGWLVITIVGGQIAYKRGKFNTEVRGQALSFV